MINSLRGSPAPQGTSKKTFISKYHSFGFLTATYTLFLFSLGPVSYISQVFNFDIFLFERYATLFFSAIFLIPALYIFAIEKHVFSIYFLIFYFLLIIIFTFSTTEPTHLAPLGFYSFSLALIIIVLSAKISDQPVKSTRNSSLLLLACTLTVTSALAIFAPSFSIQQGNRFVGFFSSPTTFATWLTAIAIFAFSPIDKRTLKSYSFRLSFLVITVLVYLTGTRINLIYLLLIAFISAYPDAIRPRLTRIALLTIFPLLIVFAYPLYNFFSTQLTLDLISYRFEGGIDTSFASRVVLFELIYELIQKSSYIDFLFGHGAEASRLVVFNELGIDLFPHNDILRLTYDFGIVFTILYISTVIYFSSLNTSTTLVGMLYFTAFLHNMLYSHYLVGMLIFLCAATYKSKAKYAALCARASQSIN